MAVIVIFIYMQKKCETFYIDKKQKNKSCLSTEFSKAQILSDILINKVEFWIFENPIIQ